MKKIALLLAVVAVSALAAASLGSSAGASTRGGGDIVSTATSAGKFTTLTKLLKRAGLVSALRQPGPYTVFAPTDAAFKKVPKKTLNTLLANRAKLRAVLLYHVVAGKVTAADVVKLTSAKTLNGKKVRIRVSGSNVFVNKSKVVKADVMATNGVIHVVNRVLIPPAR
ncbi:MAG TPA: fasciclin domain-containing protein [Gaiellaceae bacterium]|nr:fasciclin domain-containing protein [Gaiellaceae bacterium]